MPLAESIYACRDIREIPREKVMAYARALWHWAEENNLPAGGGPCLLAESVMEFVGGGEVVPLLLWWGGVQGSGPPQEEGGWESKDPFCQHPWGTLHTRVNPRKERPEVFGVGESSTSIPSSGGCWRDPPTIQGLEAKSGINSTPPECTSKASGLPTEDSHPTQTLLASTGIGTHMATNSTMWLCREWQPVYGHQS